MYLFSMLYTGSYILNYIYHYKSFHFIDWYYLSFVLFLYLIIYIIEKENRKNTFIIYVMLTIISFFLKYESKLSYKFIEELLKYFFENIKKVSSILLLTIYGISFFIQKLKKENIEKK